MRLDPQETAAARWWELGGTEGKAKRAWSEY